jgi:hypothetical protein
MGCLGGFGEKFNKGKQIIYSRGDLMKIRIEFPEDIAKERVEEAKEWEKAREEFKGKVGNPPLIWEMEEYKAPEKIKKIGSDIVLETKYAQVTLHKDEVKKIVDLAKK